METGIDTDRGIVARGLTKRYGDTTAVDNLTFTVRPGVVTGFLGPNGAGKTTTMRMIVGLAAATSGTVTVAGQRFVDLPAPMRVLGALLDAKAVHPGRTAYNHLLCLARSGGIRSSRVGEVIDEVGLSDVAGRRVGQFSLGMNQRLGIAAALLGDPAVMMFDEPVNGLDPEGIRWIRRLMRELAEQGRTVLVSSHLMSEMALTADHLIVIGRGRLIADASMSEFMAANAQGTVRVRTDDVSRFTTVVTDGGGRIRPGVDNYLYVDGLTSAEIGKLCLMEDVLLTELTPERTSLEDAFMELTRDAVEYGTPEGASK